MPKYTLVQTPARRYDKGQYVSLLLSSLMFASPEYLGSHRLRYARPYSPLICPQKFPSVRL